MDLKANWLWSKQRRLRDHDLCSLEGEHVYHENHDMFVSCCHDHWNTNILEVIGEIWETLLQSPGVTKIDGLSTKSI